jgi:hypothetical protein
MGLTAFSIAPITMARNPSICIPIHPNKKAVFCEAHQVSPVYSAASQKTAQKSASKAIAEYQ